MARRLHEPGVQRAVHRATDQAMNTKRVSRLTSAFIRDTQLGGRLGQPNLADPLRPPVKTTMIYTHVVDRGRLGAQSPIDTL